MPDRRLFWTSLGCLLWGLLWLGMIDTTRAQHMPVSEVSTYASETDINLFATIRGREPADGLRVDLPINWEMQGVVALRYGSESVPVNVQDDGEMPSAYWVESNEALQGPLEVVVQVRTPPTPGTGQWSVVPFDDEVDDEDGARHTREGQRVTQEVEVRSAPDREEGVQALSFEAEESPLLLRRDELPSITPDADFTVEFWMRTTGLDEVVLSMWDGQAESGYPIEFMVDPSGRLRYFTGEPGQHRSLRSPAPLAEGTWHHVALAHSADEGRLALMVAGEPVDSLRDARIPPAEDVTALAVGGRQVASDAESADPGTSYSGKLSEVRIWGEDRSSGATRETMRQSLSPSPERGLAGLTLEESLSDAMIERWPGAIERRSTDLIFQTPLDDLSATVSDGTVHLSWQAALEGVEAFVVEQSTDGHQFETVERVLPAEASADANDRAHFEVDGIEAADQVVFYRIRQEFTGGAQRVSGALKIGLGATEDEERDVELLGNFPNPFSESTTITYEVHRSTDVRLTVWDLSGKRIAVITDESHAPGEYERTFQAGDLPSGTYFIRLQTPEGVSSRQMTLLK